MIGYRLPVAVKTSDLPSRRIRHREAPVAVCSFLDAAWKARARGDRSTMRDMAVRAVAVMRLLPRSTFFCQSEFNF